MKSSDIWVTLHILFSKNIQKKAQIQAHISLNWTQMKWNAKKDKSKHINIGMDGAPGYIYHQATN